MQILNLVSDHRNIAGLKATYEDEANVYFILELCQGGELFDRIVEEKCRPACSVPDPLTTPAGMYGAGTV